ncbi:glycosyltransferase family 4 protein [Psychromarinibacter sp. S121]|uniref:glycosyltransferase family 4 protein n=1 Tax=Psychromarinibacter sp. S121 TaxID=3415127 RepID=UPI003C7E87F2
MRIVQLCPYDMRRPGGVQRHVRDLSRWLTAQGHETRILCPPPPGAAPGTDQGITTLGHSRLIGAHGTEFELSFAGPRALAAAVKDLRAWGAEVVHMHTPWTPFLTSQLWSRLRLPTLATVHATLPAPNAKGKTDRFIRSAATRILPGCEAIVVPSPAPLDMLARVLPDLHPQILPPAIDLSDWTAAARPRDPGRLDLAFLGRLEPRKGLDIALAAWPRISRALPHATLTIAGDGPLRAKAQAAQSDRVTVIGRPEDDAARALLGRSHMLLAPAPYGESFGLILLEAMAAGCLPVAAANAGYASVLTGPGAELLVPPNDPAALADKVIALAKAPDTLKGWATAEAARFDVTQVGPDYLKVYRSLAPQA